MMFALGFIAGLLTSGLLLLFSLLLKPKFDRTVNILGTKFKEKGKILEDAPEDLKTWMENLNKA